MPKSKAIGDRALSRVSAAVNAATFAFRAVRVVGRQCPRDVNDRAGFPVFLGEGPGDAFRAVRDNMTICDTSCL